MSGRQTAQHDGATHEEKDTKHQPTVQLDAPLRQLMSHGRPSIGDVVAVMRKYPMARIAMLETIHRELGNQFAHEVSTELQEQSANTLAPQAGDMLAAPSANTLAPLGAMGALRQSAKPVFELAKGGDLAAILKNGHTYETFADQQITTLHGVMPGYVKARNALDRDGVQQIGTVVMSSLELLRAAMSGLGEQLGKHVDPLHSSPEGDRAADIQGAEQLGQLDALQSRHKQLVATATKLQLELLMMMTPREYRGSPLADAAVPMTHVGPKGLVDVRAQLNEELIRTLTIINCAERLFIQFADPKALHDPQKRQLARHDIGAFAHRPADLTFLRAILMGAGLWQQLDSEDEHKSAAKPAPLGLEVCKESDGPLSSLYSETKKQAEQLGWLTDIGNYDRYMADLEINIGSSEGVTNVWARIMSAPADGRAQILYQMQRRGMFKPFFDKLPWHYTKELHDGLPGGHGDLKTELQKYFLVKGKWGTSLENQEYHAPSLTKMIHEGGDAVGGWGESVIDGFDSALNFMTFGFTHGYGQAQDAHSQGLITDDEYATAVRQVSTRAAVGLAIMMATGGVGRGAAAGGSSMGAASLYPSVAGTAMATGVEGAMFATTEMFALDTTDIVTGAKDHYSDATDYLKAAMIGGTMGAAVGGTSRFLSNRVAAQYATPGILTRGQSIAAQHPNLAPVLQELQAVEQGATTELRLSATQVDDLARAGLIDAASQKALREALANNQEVRAVVELHESLNASPEASANSAGNTSGKGKPPAFTVKNATPVQAGQATTAPVSLQASLPKGAIVKRVGGHGNDGWVQYELNGEQRLRFRAIEAKTLKEANPGRNMSVEEGAGVNKNGEPFVLEGRHRSIGAAKGDTIGADLGGIPGQPGVLDFEYAGIIDEEGVFVRDLTIDYTQNDVSRAEAEFIYAQRWNTK